MRSICRIVSVLFLAVIVTGCVTPGRCRVTVTSTLDSKIRSVELVDTNGNTYVFANIVKPATAADVRSDNRAMHGVMGKGLVMRIVGESGTNVSRIVDLDPPVLPQCPGCLTFQIEDNFQVRTFFWKDPGASSGDFPWAVQPAWQGAISVPGMPGNQQY